MRILVALEWPAAHFPATSKRRRAPNVSVKPCAREGGRDACHKRLFSRTRHDACHVRPMVRPIQASACGCMCACMCACACVSLPPQRASFKEQDPSCVSVFCTATLHLSAPSMALCLPSHPYDKARALLRRNLACASVSKARSQSKMRPPESASSMLALSLAALPAHAHTGGPRSCSPTPALREACPSSLVPIWPKPSGPS